jgi:enamine deaminase RidA (YjgF/YER057c/UK114 family)
VETENAFYVSGQPGWDETGEILDGIEAQTHQAFDNVAAVLAEADRSFDDIANITCYLVEPQANLEAFLGV